MVTSRSVGRDSEAGGRSAAERRPVLVMGMMIRRPLTPLNYSRTLRPSVEVTAPSSTPSQRSRAAFAAATGS